MGSGTRVSPDHRVTPGQITQDQIEDELLALVTQLTNEITWSMRERGLTRADLAARMGVSPGRVSQILGGGENLTLRTLAAMSSALDARFEIELTAVKGGDAPAGPGLPRAESAPAPNARAGSRARHREARLGR